MGRKCTLTNKIEKQIVGILEQGNYQKTAYESLGIPETSYFHWLREGEKAEKKESKLTKTEEKYLKFSQSIKKAVQSARQKNLAVIQKATEGGDTISEREFYDKDGNLIQKYVIYTTPNWQAAAWFLERTSPQEFGNKTRHEHSGKDGKPIEVQIYLPENERDNKTSAKTE